MTGGRSGRHGDSGHSLTPLLDRYGLELVEAKEISSSNNRIFLVTTHDGRYTIRLHRPGARSLHQIELEMRFLEELARVGAPAAPEVRRTAQGEAVARLDVDGRQLWATVLRWIPGRVSRPGTGAGPATVRRIGRSLGQLHDVAAAWPGSATAPSVEPVDLVVPLLPTVSVPRHRELIEDAVTAAVALFADIPTDPAHRGVVHNDVIFANCIHHGNATALIDFDDCGRAPFLQDLGGMLENIAGSPGADRLRAAFLDGYASVRRLPTEDPVALDTVVALRHAWTTAWSYGRAAAGDFTEHRMTMIADYRMAELESLLTRL